MGSSRRCGPSLAWRAVTDQGDYLLWSGELGLRVGAGEGNRTLMTSLEGWGSAIELRPRHPAGRKGIRHAS
jgi:hypothetical protein